MTRTTNRRIKQGQDQQILIGIQEGLQSIGTIHVAGTAFTPATLADFFHKRIAAANAIVTALAAWQDAIRVYRQLDAQAAVITRDLRNVVIAAFGADSEKLGCFGFVAPKKPQMTQEAKQAAVLKRAATRKARNTMGKRQRAKLTGETVLAIGPGPDAKSHD
jgi:hypothetical protein